MYTPEVYAADVYKRGQWQKIMLCGLRYQILAYLVQAMDRYGWRCSLSFQFIGYDRDIFYHHLSDRTLPGELQRYTPKLGSIMWHMSHQINRNATSNVSYCFVLTYKPSPSFVVMLQVVIMECTMPSANYIYRALYVYMSRHKQHLNKCYIHWLISMR